MAAENLNMSAEVRVEEAIRWMEAHGRQTSFLCMLEHELPEFMPHERLPDYERAAEARGLYLHYVGAEAHAIEGDTPLYYVFISKKPSLSHAEIREMIPGFQPIRPEPA